MFYPKTASSTDVYLEASQRLTVVMNLLNSHIMTPLHTRRRLDDWDLAIATEILADVRGTLRAAADHAAADDGGAA